MAAMGGLTLRGEYTTMKCICLLELQHEVRKNALGKLDGFATVCGHGPGRAVLPASPLALDPAALRPGGYGMRGGRRCGGPGLRWPPGASIESCDAWGGRSLLGAVEAGQIFAEAYACLPGEPLMVRVVAAGDAEVIFLKAEALLREPPPSPEPGGAAGPEEFAAFPAHALHRAAHHPPAADGLPAGGGGAAGQPELCHSLQPAGAGGLPEVDRSALSTEISKMRREGWLRAQGKQLCAHRAGGVIFPHAWGLLRHTRQRKQRNGGGVC